MDLGAVLQLNSHSLMAEFHQKPAENNETRERLDLCARPARLLRQT